jgi:glycosyltransferase involved in cell wall biosynthesis
MTREFVVDGIFYQIGKSGIARVWNKLLEEWVRTGFAERVVVIDRQRTAQRAPGVLYHDAPAFYHERTREDRQMLQTLCQQYGARAFISTYYSIPETTPSLMMVHDMIPEVLGWDMSQPMWQQKQDALAYASAFVAVSTNTAVDVRRYIDRPEREVTVALNGCDFTAPDAAEVAAFKSRCGIDRPYFMLSGSRSDYKNAVQFFKAFAQLGDQRAQLAILCTGGGGLEPDMAACVGQAKVHIGILSDDELRCAYAGATALVYPSLYEGFGLPVLEAMACGAPVICSKAASLPEVGGQAALYVDLSGAQTVEETQQLADALRTVMDPEVSAVLRAQGLQQAGAFTWARMATTVQGCLERVADQASGQGAADADMPTDARAFAPCRLCGAAARHLFHLPVLGRLNVAYQQCTTCGAGQTEPPHWLNAELRLAAQRLDTGVLTRALVHAGIVQTLLLLTGLAGEGKSPRVLDHGCRTGLLVRTLRDMGIDAWGTETDAPPALALGFQADGVQGFDLVYAGDALSSQAEPGAVLKHLMSGDPAILVMQPSLVEHIGAKGEGLSLDLGTQVCTLTPRTLDWISQRFGRQRLTVLGCQVWLKPEMAAGLVDPQTARLAPEHEAFANLVLSRLWQGLFAQPYHHANLDRARLQAAAASAETA